MVPHDVRAGQYDIGANQKRGACQIALGAMHSQPSDDAPRTGRTRHQYLPYHLRVTFKFALTVPSTRITPVFPPILTPNSTATSLQLFVTASSFAIAWSANSATLAVASFQAPVVILSRALA